MLNFGINKLIRVNMCANNRSTAIIEECVDAQFRKKFNMKDFKNMW